MWERGGHPARADRPNLWAGRCPPTLAPAGPPRWGVHGDRPVDGADLDRGAGVVAHAVAHQRTHWGECQRRRFGGAAWPGQGCGGQQEGPGPRRPGHLLQPRQHQGGTQHRNQGRRDGCEYPRPDSPHAPILGPFQPSCDAVKGFLDSRTAPLRRRRRHRLRRTRPPARRVRGRVLAPGPGRGRTRRAPAFVGVASGRRGGAGRPRRGLRGRRRRGRGRLGEHVRRGGRRRPGRTGDRFHKPHPH